jgi:hypothetical protein
MSQLALERWIIVLGSLIISPLLFLLVYKLSRLNWNKQKMSLWTIPFFWYRYLYKSEIGRIFLKWYPLVVALILIWFNLVFILIAIGILKPIYEDSTGTIYELSEANGKQYIDYRGEDNVEIKRVELGQECEGEIINNTIEFCKPGLKCIAGTCQKSPYN